MLVFNLERSTFLRAFSEDDDEGVHNSFSWLMASLTKLMEHAFEPRLGMFNFCAIANHYCDHSMNLQLPIQGSVTHELGQSMNVAGSLRRYALRRAYSAISTYPQKFCEIDCDVSDVLNSSNAQAHIEDDDEND